MDLKEILEKKEQFRKDIHNLVSDFKEDTGVKNVFINTVDTKMSFSNDYIITDIIVEIKI